MMAVPLSHSYIHEKLNSLIILLYTLFYESYESYICLSNEYNCFHTFYNGFAEKIVFYDLVVKKQKFLTPAMFPASV